MAMSRQRAAELLKEAAELINGERAKNYGEPEQSFENIAQHWATYLGIPISVHDVAMMMVLLKVSRGGRTRAHRDNPIDICGYAALDGSDDVFYPNHQLKVNNENK